MVSHLVRTRLGLTDRFTRFCHPPVEVARRLTPQFPNPRSNAREADSPTVCMVVIDRSTSLSGTKRHASGPSGLVALSGLQLGTIQLACSRRSKHPNVSGTTSARSRTCPSGDSEGTDLSADSDRGDLPIVNGHVHA